VSAADEVGSLPARLRRVQTDVDDAEAALALRRELRRQLVHETLDAGAMSQRQVARALGRGTGLVSKILGDPGPEE
jgi:predicted XRE-type DNA-binding protein